MALQSVCHRHQQYFGCGQDSLSVGARTQLIHRMLGIFIATVGEHESLTLSHGKVRETPHQHPSSHHDEPLQ